MNNRVSGQPVVGRGTTARCAVSRHGWLIASDGRRLTRMPDLCCSRQARRDFRPQDGITGCTLRERTTPIKSLLRRRPHRNWSLSRTDKPQRDPGEKFANEKADFCNCVAGFRQQRASADVAIATNHADRSVSAGRINRRDRTYHGRTYAAPAGPACHC